MKLIEFAEKYNVKVKKLEGELVIPGRKVNRNDDSLSSPQSQIPAGLPAGTHL